MKRLLAAAIGVVAIAQSASGAERTIKVTGPGCDYQVRFDPAKADPKQVRDTAEVLLGEGLPAPDYAGHATTDAVSAATIESDRAQCLAPGRKIKGLALLDMPGLKDLVAGRMAAIEDGCAFQTIKSRALVTGASPKILLEHKPSVQACGAYAKALETPAAMRTFWRAQVDRQCANNASPAKCRKASLALEEKPDAGELIRRDLIAFHWNNCANELTMLSVNQSKDEAALEGLRKAFKLRFKTREKCEEG
ncbi:MAG TPA: hypothetical protein PKA55_15410 [Rhodoblastus sp.]|nr:hypothetical protein [Rhodoblastus sp.]